MKVIGRDMGFSCDGSPLFDYEGLGTVVREIGEFDDCRENFIRITRARLHVKGHLYIVGDRSCKIDLKKSPSTLQLIPMPQPIVCSILLDISFLIFF